MNRTKHVVLLIIKIVFILLCFVVNLVVSALNGYSGQNVNILHDNVEYCSFVAEGDAWVDFEKMEDGRMALYVEQGSTPVPMTVYITSKKLAFNRAYYEEILGSRAEDYTEFFDKMDAGPWNIEAVYTLTAAEGDTDGMFYTVHTADGRTDSVPLGTSFQTPSFAAERNEQLDMQLTIGSEDGAPLPAGTYYLDVYVRFLSATDGTPIALSSADTARVLGNTVAGAFREATWSDLFGVTSWLQFYGVIIAFGCFFYLWKDIKHTFRIACAVGNACYSEGTEAIVSYYVNGHCVGTERTTVGGTSGIFAAIVAFVLVYMFLLLTLPLRLIIQMVMDIVYLIIDDEKLEGVSVTGNLLGSLGLYVSVFGFMLLVGQMANFLIALLVLAAGIGMIIGANALTKRAEENYF